MNVVGSKWAYKVQLHFNEFYKYVKARLVVTGYNRIVDIDFEDTFNPVIKIRIIRIIITLALTEGWTIR